MNEVSQHYAHGSLLADLTEALARADLSRETVTADDLAPLDEFHIGGRRATDEFLSQLGLTVQDRVIDLGCGIGGPARFAFHRFGCSVVGVDLMPEYIEAARMLTQWTSLTDGVRFEEGSGLELPFEAETFDAAYMLHVGMNISDKASFFAEVGRVLKPGGRFGIYDIMRISDGPLQYPLPWASSESSSFVERPSDYRSQLERSGFSVSAERVRHRFAVEVFEQSRTPGPSALGLHVILGDRRKEKLANMVDLVKLGRVAPTEMVAYRVSGQ